MRVLLLSQFYPPIIGGEERHVMLLAQTLARRGHDVKVATLATAGCPAHERINGVDVHRLQGAIQRLGNVFTDSNRRHAPPFPEPELAVRIGMLAASFKPDVVHAHNWILHSYIPYVAVPRPRLVVTLHDYSLVCAKKSMTRCGVPCEGPTLSRCLPCASAHYGRTKGAVTYFANAVSEKVARRFVDTFIPVSRAVARQTGLDTARGKYEIVPTFIDDDCRDLSTELDPCLESLPKTPYLLFVGDLVYLKGINTLLKAYERLVNAPPLVLIGRRCQDTPAELPPNVTMLESWPHRAIMHAWNRCLFGLVPSIGQEACPTVVMEANALGKPVIGSDIGGIPDLIVEGRTGLLVPPDDADALRASMQTLIDDDELRERLGRGAYEHANGFMSSVVVPRIEDIYMHAAPRLHGQMMQNG